TRQSISPQSSKQTVCSLSQSTPHQLPLSSHPVLLELLSVNENVASPFKSRDQPPVLCGGGFNRHFVARLEHVARRPFRRLCRRVLSFDHPVFRLARLILHVQPQIHVRVGPHELCYGTFDRNEFRSVVRSISMMRPDRSRTHKTSSK